MKKQTKTNTNTIIISILLIIIFIFVFIYIKNENQQRSNQNKINCSNKSEELFNNYINKLGDYDKQYNINNYNYENHYSDKLNGCFIVIIDNDKYSYSSTLYNVYENKELGGIYATEKMSGMCGLEIKNSYIECKSNQKEGQSFTAKEEFNELTKFYMEN